ncbi:MAG: glycosyltransferase [Phycisphaera sp.]|nr:glycosyltransferase [Phycisphaera sp.]
MSTSTFPRISLVTPSFNQKDFLEETLRSVLDQKYPNLQYGVVDGGSTDGSVEVLERYRDRLDYVVIEKDDGQSQAINKGLARCDGEVVGYLNSDDTLLPGALERVATVFREDPACNWLIGRCRVIDEHGQRIGAITPTGEFTLAGALVRQSRFEVPQPATFWRRSLHSHLGYLDESLHHCMDFELWCRFLANGIEPHFEFEELATYRMHAHSKSCAEQSRFIEALIRIEGWYAPNLPWVQKMTLHRMMGYQRRALAVQSSAGKRELLAKVVSKPWWLASQQVRAALFTVERANRRNAA